MSTYSRQCNKCYGGGSYNVITSAGSSSAVECGECDGTGRVMRPITAPVTLRLDNRAPQDFIMSVHPDGRLTFRRKGHRTTVATTVQAAFNRAQAETAAAAVAAAATKEPRRRRLVSRGLLTTGR